MFCASLLRAERWLYHTINGRAWCVVLSGPVTQTASITDPHALKTLKIPSRILHSGPSSAAPLWAGSLCGYQSNPGNQSTGGEKTCFPLPSSTSPEILTWMRMHAVRVWWSATWALAHSAYLPCYHGELWAGKGKCRNIVIRRFGCF